MRGFIRGASVVLIVLGFTAWGVKTWSAGGTYTIFGAEWTSPHRVVTLEPPLYDSDNRRVSSTMRFTDDRGFVTLNITQFAIVTSNDTTGQYVYHAHPAVPLITYGTGQIAWTFTDWQVPIGETFAGVRIDGTYQVAPGQPMKSLATRFAATIGP